jgi:hypothetical protein
MTIQLTQVNPDTQPCSLEAFLLSVDGGMTWRQLPPYAPLAPPVVNYEWCHLTVTARHLFLAYGFALNGGPEVSQLERSDDDGASWVRADNGLHAGTNYLSPVLGSGNQLAMIVVHTSLDSSATTNELWTSTDAGQTWQRIGSPPPGGAFLLTAGAAVQGTWSAPSHPFYTLAGAQTPSDLYLEVVYATGNGVIWNRLPALPVAGLGNVRQGVLQALATLPDGRLAVWGPNPQGGMPIVPREPMTAFWLWLWAPATQRWQVLPTPLDATAYEGCGLCWSAHVSAQAGGPTYLYVGAFQAHGANGGVIPAPGFFRVQVPT